MKDITISVFFTNGETLIIDTAEETKQNRFNMEPLPGKHFQESKRIWLLYHKTKEKKD